MSEPISIRWHRPSADAVRRACDSPAPAGLVQVATAPIGGPTHVRRSMSTAQVGVLAETGIPVPVGNVSARDYAVHLLRVAAEVEHALMVQYLYAATSLDPSVDTSPENYVAKVMRIAVQEMGHLATVQNMLLLTGGSGAVHMQRDTLRKNDPVNPIPFVLEPIGPAAIAKFVVAEMPATIPAVKVQQVAKLLALAKRDSGAEPHRVGAIYTVLRWLFMPRDEANAWVDLTSLADLDPDFRVSDADLTPAAEMQELEAGVDEWNANAFGIILANPRNCADVVAAIDLVSAQGEGWDSAGDTHFAEFLEMDDALTVGLPAGLVRPIAKSPTLTPGNGGENYVLIEDSYTAAWGAVFSLQYSLLVLSIYHSLVLRRPTDGSPGLRGVLAEMALGGMRRIIGPVSEVLAGLPLRSGEPSLAGPPYDLDPQFLAPGEQEDLQRRHLEALDRLAGIYDQIERDPAFAGHVGHDVVISNLRVFDTKRRNLFPNRHPQE